MAIVYRPIQDLLPEIKSALVNSQLDLLNQGKLRASKYAQVVTSSVNALEQLKTENNQTSLKTLAPEIALVDSKQHITQQLQILDTLKNSNRIESRNQLPKLTLENFSSAVRSLLATDAQGKIHEEEFQYAITVFLLNNLKNGLGTKFQEAFNKVIGSGERPLQVEDAVKLSIEVLIKDGLLSKDEANYIAGISFDAAQLDSNLNALWDDRGSATDMTIAVLDIDEAIKRATEALNDIFSGKRSVSPRDTFNPGAISSGVSNNTSELSGFLWKPDSERDGNLVVLMPSYLRGQIESLEIHSKTPPSNESLIETGVFSGDLHNGQRVHFRFSKKGGVYPDNAYVIARIRDGSTITLLIPNTSNRLEY